MTKLTATLLAFALLAAHLRASPGPDQKHIDAIKKKVASCLENARHVTIATYDNRILQGYIPEAGPDSFVVSFQGNPTTLLYTDVKKIKWPSPMSKQAQTILVVAAVTGGMLLSVFLLGGLRN
jgi:hypothetical protein